MRARAVASTLSLPSVPYTAVAAILAIAAFGIYLTNDQFNLGAYWFIGVAFGVILQRSRLCFAGAFRDLVMSGDGRLMRAIIAGLAVATVGFSLLMARFVPQPGFGVLPPGAHIQTVGLATAFGGLIFGVGMVLAGGCGAGSLWRAGEGHVKLWCAVIAFALAPSVFRRFLEQNDRVAFLGNAVFLPDLTGWTLALVLIAAVLLAWYLFATWNEKARRLVSI